MAGMVSLRRFVISLVCLVAATCGLLGFLFISFAFFTYQGNGMDWIYPAAGLCVLLWMWSAWVTVTSGIAAVEEYLYRKRKSKQHPDDL
jgi:membrane protease YdiL (CAAX protease family)